MQDVAVYEAESHPIVDRITHESSALFWKFSLLWAAGLVTAIIILL